jgi:subtilisin-like proprotein convertase family protein
MGSNVSNMSSIRLTFDRAMNASTFTPADVVLKSPSGATITISSVKQVDSLGKVFDVVFATQWTKGGYSLKVGPNVKDKNGVSMTPYSGNVALPRSTTTATASVASVAPQSVPVAYSSTTSAAITPNGKAVVMLTVKDDYRIADVNVRVNLTLTTPADLFVHLRAPDGTDVVLTKQTDGSYGLETPASELADKSLNGTWTLWVEDRGGNRGTVDGFSLVVTPQG